MSITAFQYETFDAYSPHGKVGPYRADDYWQLPEGAPVELIRGRFMMSPSPLPLHQIVLGSLNHALREVEMSEGGLTLMAPMDVVLSEDTILQPDLLYIAKDRRSMVRSRIEGPPDLVIEILSPGSERCDRLEKLDLYARYQVPEYWIVDPKLKLFEFLINEKGRYVVMPQSDEHYQSPRLPALRIDLVSFWQEVDQRLPKT